MQISLCMIVKDEEEYIEQCLNSVKDLVSEIIIVDTGSTDKTKVISKKFTDLIFDYKWENDFAKARNYSISKATKDWILFLDADEILLPSSFDIIKTAILSEKNKVFAGKIESVYSDGRKTLHYISRLFENYKYIFKYRLHEQLFKLGGERADTCRLEGFDIKHFGYSFEAKNKKDKLRRNEELLKIQIEEDPENPFHHYNLQNVYHSMRKFDLSLVSFYNMLKFIKEYNPREGNNYIPHSFLVAISCYIENKELDKALHLLEQGIKFKTGLNYYFYFKAFCCFKLKDFIKTLIYLDLSKKSKSIPLVIQGDISLGTCILTAHSLFNLQKYSQALVFYEKLKNLNSEKYKEVENIAKICYAKHINNKEVINNGE